jgi:O-antigen ligase
VSLNDSKQLVLFAIVPVAYRFITASKANTLMTVLVSCGAVSAAYGIVQFGILQYDQLDMRPRGTLGHYMTYAGLLMLVMGVALARILFAGRDRAWPVLVMPALAVAVALSSTRSAWVGACAGASLLFVLKDFRLVAILPIVAAVFLAAAPAMITARFMSIFDMNDPTIRDRAAMLRIGERMIRSHPLTGVGPNMVQARYAEYRDERAVELVNPHLHNVPMQIAAERGIPALAAWLAFVLTVVTDLGRRFHAGRHRVLSAAALAAMMSMLTAGLFEYNFGDSEFLMLLLLIITLPFAAARPAAHDQTA